MALSSSQRISEFWQEALQEAEAPRAQPCEPSLPLARIKRLMKIEEDVRMVASEVPVLFSLVADVFVQELTLRAWIHTEESKRRILQRGDVSAAVKTSPMYDFLVYIVPPYDYGELDACNLEIMNRPVALGHLSKDMNYNQY